MPRGACQQTLENMHALTALMSDRRRQQRSPLARTHVLQQHAHATFAQRQKQRTAGVPPNLVPTRKPAKACKLYSQARTHQRPRRLNLCKATHHAHAVVSRVKAQSPHMSAGPAHVRSRPILHSTRPHTPCVEHRRCAAQPCHAESGTTTRELYCWSTTGRYSRKCSHRVARARMCSQHLQIATRSRPERRQQATTATRAVTRDAAQYTDRAAGNRGLVVAVQHHTRSHDSTG